MITNFGNIYHPARKNAVWVGTVAQVMVHLQFSSDVRGLCIAEVDIFKDSALPSGASQCRKSAGAWMPTGSEVVVSTCMSGADGHGLICT